MRMESTVTRNCSPVRHEGANQDATRSSRPSCARGDGVSGATESRHGHGVSATAVCHRASHIHVTTFTKHPKFSLEFDARRPKASCLKNHCYSTSLKPLKRFITESLQKDGILA